MKALCAAAIVAFGLIGAASAQPYDGGYRGDGYDYRDRGDGYGYRERGNGYRERGDGYGERRRGYRDHDDEDDRGYRGRRYGFDEREYLRCNPDVRRAVERGIVESGAAHFRAFGRRENRRLSC